MTRIRGGARIELEFHRWRLQLFFTRHYDRSSNDPNATRSVFIFSLKKPNREWSMMAQLYRTGYGLIMHTDGPKRCPSAIIRLFGEDNLRVYGPFRKRLFGRATLFDASTPHCVIPVSRPRFVLMFQSATWRMGDEEEYK